VSVPSNQLQELRFLSATNAAITAPGGPVGALGNFPVMLPVGTQQVTFTIRALAASLAVPVPFVVVDNCGDWSTFAGGGPDLFPVATNPADPPAIPVLISPTGLSSMQTVNFFDHDLPFEFTDTNGYQLTYWGERWTGGVDGHSGYDWPLPVGTPLFAAAAGKVVLAGVGTPFFCPPLNKIVTDQLIVEIDFSAESQRFIIVYDHLSRIDVVNGQMATRGQQVGLSGNTG
jgi:murein DD-endopeptidase MepM/ murein hydrolase activator NlpD